jgi:hypothetical protein
MTIIDKLTLTNKTKAGATISPEARVRNKMLVALDVQIAAAEAQANGETYIKRAMRWITDNETGERVRKEVPVRFNRWHWTDESGAVFIQLRYGNKPLELKKGKPTIELSNENELLPMLRDVRIAIIDGEFDAMLMAAKKERAANWQRSNK